MFCRILSQLVAALLFAAFAQQAHAQFSSIASSPDNYSWITDATQAGADRAVLAHCNKGRPKPDCKLVRNKAIAHAIGEERIGYATSRIGSADAKSRAIAHCGIPSCKVKIVDTDPGFYAFVIGRKAEDAPAGYSYLLSGGEDLNALQERVLAQCRGEGWADCELADFGVIAGRHIASSRPARRNVSERSCRPTTPTIRCSSNCVNGDCEITYENGCKMRVQVQSRYDSFSRQWTYPAPSC